LGAQLVVFTFVLAQFVDGTLDLLLQAISALIIFPLAFLLMRHVRISILLVQFGVALVAANSAAYVVRGDFYNLDLLRGNFFALSGFVTAILLYTALTQYEEAFSLLGRLWVAFAVVASVLAILQAMGFMPLWSVPEDELGYRMVGAFGLYRGTGLKGDPNFQAFMLIFGAVFARFYVKKFQLAVILIIMLGILATFSRMGILVAILVLLAAPMIQARISRQKSSAASIRALGSAVLLAVAGVLTYVFAPQSVQLYLAERAGYILRAYHFLATGHPTNLDSAGQRIQLFTAGVDILPENFLFGLGAYGTPEAIKAVSGVAGYAHNAYLDMLLMGGLWGALVLASYFILLRHALIRSYHAQENKHRRSLIATLLLAFFLVGFFLDVSHNSILWLPLVLALAHLSMSSPSLRERGYADPADRR
jgi:O-antigen ligase